VAYPTVLHYSEQFSWWPKLYGFSFYSIDVEEALWLERDFEESEVFEVVKTLNDDKAWGLDGFSLAFFQACWEVLKEDVMNVFLEFHVQRMFERSLNATFIALIPKKAGAVNIKDFRLISLVGDIIRLSLKF